MIKFCFVVLISLAAARSENEGESLILGNSYLRVKTSNGYVEGDSGQSSRTGKEFARFRGIPYAEPPLGKLRFRDPIPKKSWEGTWNATFSRPACIQKENYFISFPQGFSEDCLYLNVYSPNLKYLKYGLGSPKAVIVFIHPGAFNTGSGIDYFFGPDFLLDQDVVVVAFEYRLGALGFLSFQNEQVPGNAGLKDQNLALKWVKNNIRHFGGDPARITIFGESAGSASVHYHILSKASEGLFNNAIMSSGSALSRWAYSPPKLALKKARILAKKVGCLHFFSKFDEILECMQNVPIRNIIRHQRGSLPLEDVFSLRIIAFHPTTEPDVAGAFLTADPFDLMYSGNFTKVPAIIGLNSNEGLLIYPVLKYDTMDILLSLVGKDLSRFAPSSLHLKPHSESAKYAHQMISSFYFNSKNLTRAQTWNALELVSDVMFTLPIQLTVSLMANYAIPVYNYYFTYIGGQNVLKNILHIMDTPGVCHGDDLGYLFYIKALDRKYGNPNVSFTPQDNIMIDRMTKMWTNFAKTGQPTLSSKPQIEGKWEPFTATRSNYLEIGRELIPSVNLKMENMAFWNGLISNLIKMAAAEGNQEDNVNDETV